LKHEHRFVFLCTCVHRAENEDNDRAENADIEKLKQNIENLDIKNPFEGAQRDYRL
jgi:hypothetical protein